MSKNQYELALDRATEILLASKRVVVLTGAGVSAESGVPTFRASDGLWEGHKIEDVATPMGFERDPALVWQFYNARRVNVSNVNPNPGHIALAKLEERWGENFTLATQNVDGLHQQAGSKNVLELHGSLRRTKCTGCEVIEYRGLDCLGDLPKCPTCSSLLRPDIVWFHEALDEGIWSAAQAAAATCDVLLVVGTSAVVYPVAQMIPLAKNRRFERAIPANVIEFNLTKTEASRMADVGIYGPSGESLPKLVNRLGDA